MTIRQALVLAVFSLLHPTICSERVDNDAQHTIAGVVQSYVELSSNGSVESVGVAFPLELVYNTTLAKVVLYMCVCIEGGWHTWN